MRIGVHVLRMLSGPFQYFIDVDDEGWSCV